jgi:hypothetical protein
LRRKVAASPIVPGHLAPGQELLAHAFQILGTAIAPIVIPFVKKLTGIALVYGQAEGLTVWTVPSTDVMSLVPVDGKPP